MPYIKKSDRDSIDPTLNKLFAENSGELNYLMTALAVRYIIDHGLKYETLNAVVGAFESAKAEFQRRLVAPYEDTKITHNGDVYPPLEAFK